MANDDNDWLSVGWKAFENNDAQFNSFLTCAGFKTWQYSFNYLYSTDKGELASLPGPAIAAIVLYPKKFAGPLPSVKDRKLVLPGPDNIDPNDTTQNANPEDTWFLRSINNGICGLESILHSIMNLPHNIRNENLLDLSRSWLRQFRLKCPPAMNSIDKAKHLEWEWPAKVWNNRVTTGEPYPSDHFITTDRDGEYFHHFISFVHLNGEIVEFDGQKTGPTSHGPTDNFLSDVCRIVKDNLMKDVPPHLEHTQAILALQPCPYDPEPAKTPVSARKNKKKKY